MPDAAQERLLKPGLMKRWVSFGLNLFFGDDVRPRLSLLALLGVVLIFGLGYGIVLEQWNSLLVQMVLFYCALALSILFRILLPRSGDIWKYRFCSCYLILLSLLLGMSCGSVHALFEVVVPHTTRLMPAARIMDGLDKHLKNNGTYPMTLDELVPKYLSAQELKRLDGWVEYTAPNADGEARLMLRSKTRYWDEEVHIWLNPLSGPKFNVFSKRGVMFATGSNTKIQHQILGTETTTP